MPHDLDNLADAVRRAASDHADAVALVRADNPSDLPGPAVLTWQELDLRVDAVATGLQSLDLPGRAGFPARVAISLPNVPEFAETFFGTLRAGLVAVPVNPGYTPRELRHLLADSGASVLITTRPGLEALASIRAELPELSHVYVLEAHSTPDSSPAGNAPADETPVDHRPLAELAAPDGSSGPGVPATMGVPATTGGEDLAVLLYTSGTSGAPKGAMLSHRALLANHRQVAGVDPPIMGPGDVVLLALPLFHVFGLNAGLAAVAYHGATGVLVDRFDPERTLAAITTHQVSVVAAVPQMYVAWVGLPDLGDDLTSVRVAVSGAAPLDITVARRFLEATRHPIFEGYGLTETSPVVATGLASPVAKPGSIGRPIPGVEVKLVSGDGTDIARVSADGLLAGDAHDDFDDDAGDAPGTDPGEIVVRGANLFSGYWPTGAGGPDAEGWWGTGDVAYADADGDLFLVDRLGDLILVSGFNVYPQEVELVLASHPAVVESAVLGFADPITGQGVRAYVVVAEGGSVEAGELRAHCERNLARFKCPAEYEFVAELPHSIIGKVRKNNLRATAP